MRVLLTGARAPVTLDLTRRLSSCGVQVFLADSLRFGTAAISSRVRSLTKSRMFLVPRPKERPHQFIDSINNIITTYDIDLLIPTCEEAFFLSHFKAKIACECFVAEFELMNRIHNKWFFSEFASNRFATVPETILLKNSCDIQKLGGETTDWVFKPVYSRFASETLIGPNAKKLESIVISKDRQWIAQKRIHGKEYSTYGVARNGKLVAHACYFSKHRIGKASGIYFENISDSRIVDFVRHFVKATNYTGQIGFDLIVDTSDRVWVLEGNPRATSGLHMFDSDQKLVDALLGKRSVGGRNQELVLANPSKPQMVAIGMLIWGFKQALFSGRPISFFRDFFGAQDVVWRWSDMIPTLGVPLTLAELMVIAIKKRMTLPQASTFDIEWNGESIE